MELGRLFDLFWRRKWILIATTLVTIGVAVFGTRYITPVYKASTVLRVAVSASGTLNYQDYMYTDRLMNTYVEIAKSEPVARELAKRLQFARAPAIDARIIPNTELIEVTVEDTDPTRAATEANTLAEILIAQDNQLYTGGGAKLTDVLQAQINEVQSEVDGARQQYEKMLLETPPAPNNIEAARELLGLKQTNYASLQSQYEQAQFRQEIQANMISVWQTASIPKEPVRPVPFLNYGLGLLVGLVGGIALVLVSENLDTTLYTTADIEKAAGRTALAKVPKGNKKQLTLVQRDYSPLTESFRKLATVLHQRHGLGAGKVMLVISAEPTQGKSTVVLHLAVSLAELGKSVIVLDCDTRMPRQHRLFHLSNKPGLKEVLEGSTSLEDALQPSPYDGLGVLTSGSSVTHPSKLLGSADMAKLIATLRQRFDYILLDSPALLAAADVAALRPYADCLILVVRRAHAKRDALQAAGSFLDESTDKLTYLVVNQAESNDSYGYYRYRTKPDALTLEFQEMLKPSKKSEPLKAEKAD